MTDTSNNQPDWDVLAERFDLWLPYLAPVNEPLLAGLKIERSATPLRMLDVACGTGEPSMSLLEAFGEAIDLQGVDAAEGMLGPARKKAAARGIEVPFDCMPAEALVFDDNQFDRIVSRFGVMLFTDSQAGLKEMARVLAPGGRISIAVWGQAHEMGGFLLTDNAIKAQLPDAATPFAAVTSLGQPAVLEAMLKTAGFTDIEITAHQLPFRFDHFDQYWDLMEQSGVLSAPLGQMTADQQAAMRQQLADDIAALCPGDSLDLPQTYLTASARL